MIAGSAMALAGCQSFLGDASLGHRDGGGNRAALARANLTPATDEGRLHLDAGRTGLAIEAFQVALATGEPHAPALNGMGVAYARLGRGDTAKRFFEAAIALDPSDQRYAANLNRMMGSPELAAQRHDSQVARQDTAAASPAKPIPAATTAMQQVRQAASTLVRLSRQAFHVGGEPAQTAALQPALSGNSARTAPQTKPAPQPRVAAAPRVAVPRISTRSPLAVRRAIATPPNQVRMVTARSMRAVPVSASFKPVVRIVLASATVTPGGRVWRPEKTRILQ